MAVCASRRIHGCQSLAHFVRRNNMCGSESFFKCAPINAIRLSEIRYPILRTRRLRRTFEHKDTAFVYDMSCEGCGFGPDKQQVQVGFPSTWIYLLITKSQLKTINNTPYAFPCFHISWLDMVTSKKIWHLHPFPSFHQFRNYTRHRLYTYRVQTSLSFPSDDIFFFPLKHVPRGQ